jgi:hypothetical protein
VRARSSKAQARLGHRDPATTLRHYAHATPLDDRDVADEIDELLNRAIATDAVTPPMACGSIVQSTSSAALGDHERANRLDGTISALGCTAGPTYLGGSGGADSIERVGLALPAAVLRVGAVDLDDPHGHCCIAG